MVTEEEEEEADPLETMLGLAPPLEPKFNCKCVVYVCMYVCVCVCVFVCF